MRRQNCLSSVSKSALKVAAVVLLVIAMLTMNLSSFVSYAGTPTLVPFTNQGHDNDFEQIDYSRDFVVLQNKATINGQSRKAFYFEDELTDADYTALGGKSNICLEYHSVTADCETFAAMPYYDEANVLGVAGQFHIVAFDKFTSGAHTNGNILANEAAMSKNFGTNELPNGEANYIVNYSSVIASSVPKNDEPIALGIDNTVAIRDNGHKFAINGTEVDRPKILYRDSASKKFINLADVEKDAKDLSAELAKNKVDSGITRTTSSEATEYHLDNPDSVGYINVKASEISKLNEGSSGDMNITGFTAGKNGSVIVNVDMTGVNKVTLPERSFVFIDNTKQDTDEKTSFVAGRVIWNFINAEGKTITTGQMTGTILAPGADIVIPTNLNGTVIADKINNTGETHRDDFVGKTDTPPDDDVPPTDDTPEPPTPPVQKPEHAKASATFEGIKHVVGDENATIADYEGAFEFDLYDELGEEIQKAYNGANGSFSFETIVYDKAGTFRYTIREKHFGETIDEITYDDAEYIVQVKVSLDEDTNSLVAEVTMRGVRVSEPFEFTNEITPPHDNEPPKGDHDTPPSGDPDEDEVPPTEDEVPPTEDEVPPTDEEVPPTDDEVPPTDDEDTPDDPVNTPNDEDPTEDNTVNTADETEILLWTVELLTAAGALALVVRARKRSR